MSNPKKRKRKGEERKGILLIDTSNLLHKVITLMNRKGFWNHNYATDMLVSLAQRKADELELKDMIFFIDRDGDTFWKNHISSYQKYRKPRNLTLEQEEWKEEVGRYLLHKGYKIIWSDDRDADTLISIYAHTLTSPKNRRRKYTDAVIFSSDKDFTQTITPNISVASISPKQTFLPELLTSRNFWSFYPFKPERMALYKAIVGDKSDSIPQIMSISPHAIAPMLNRSRTPEDLLALLTEIKENPKSYSSDTLKIAKMILKRDRLLRKNWLLIKLPQSRKQAEYFDKLGWELVDKEID